MARCLVTRNGHRNSFHGPMKVNRVAVSSAGRTSGSATDHRVPHPVVGGASAGPAGTADRNPVDLHRPVERVPVAVPGHQAAGDATARGLARELHRQRGGGPGQPLRRGTGGRRRPGPTCRGAVRLLPAPLHLYRPRLWSQGMTVTTTVPYTLNRLHVVMAPEPGNPLEAEGVLNPASGRTPDGQLYLLPRLVAEGNVSRVGIARVVLADGVPVGVEREGVVLAPDAGWEHGLHHAGTEDPRTTWVPSLGLHVMSYVAFGPLGPQPALAISADLRSWRRIGPVHFEYLSLIHI